MKKVKISLLTLVLIFVSGAAIGCGSRERENVTTRINAEDTKNKDRDESEASTGDETEVNIENDSVAEQSKDDESNSKEKESSLEEDTTPLDGETGADVETSTSVSEKTTTSMTTTSTVTTTSATTTQPVATTTATEQVTTKPTVAETTTKNYGAVVDSARDKKYVEKYSRRGFSTTAYTTAENIINSILTTSMSEAQRVRAIHDWLVKNVNYDYDTAANIGNVTGYESAFTAEGALINKLAVCEGYSEAFLLLCWTTGIDARIIEGTGNGGAHEWNVVKIDGKWYQIDVTFDDPLVNNTIDTTGGNMSYDYFLLTTADMCADHTISSCYNDTLPSCTSTDYYEYAKQCTLDFKLGDTPYVIISNYEQAKTAVASYNYQGIKEFAFVYAEGILDANTLYQTVCDVTVNNLSYYGGGRSVSASGSYMNTIGYTIAIVKLTISN